MAFENALLRPAEDQDLLTRVRTAPAEGAGSPDTFIDDWTNEVAERVRPSIVTVYGHILLADQIDPNTGEVQKPTYVRAGSGSGFFISEDGTIVTNRHVVEGCDGISIRLSSGEIRLAKLLYVSPVRRKDIAILKISDERFPDEEYTPVKIGDSGLLRQGDPVISMGSPAGIRGLIATGVVSGIPLSPREGDSEEDKLYKFFIKTDADIHPGNSGGVLINKNGEVIGINTAIRPTNAGAIGLSIPINEFATLLKYKEIFFGMDAVFHEVMEAHQAEDNRPGIEASFRRLAKGVKGLVETYAVMVFEQYGTMPDTRAMLREIGSDTNTMYYFFALLSTSPIRNFQKYADIYADTFAGASLGMMPKAEAEDED